MIEKTNLQINNQSGLDIDIDCFNPKSAEPMPLVIFCHGFKGFKDWGGFPYLMNKLAEAGFFAVSFNFSCNGVSKKNPLDFTRLDLFAENTFSKELEDLRLVINYFFDNASGYNIDKNKIALIGHSRGGGTAILQTAEDKRIKALLTLAAVSHFGRYGKEHKKRWKEKGYFEIENTRTKQMMKLNISLLEDIEKNKDKLNIIKAASNIDIPWLIIHGKEDLSVKYNEAEELFEKTNKKKAELLLIENTGHTFGTVHPFEGTTKAFEIVIGQVTGFLKIKLILR
jgi:dienelactone hydrolase